MKKEAKTKKITIDKLAKMVANGFRDAKIDIERLAISTAKSFENTATKDDIKDMATKMDIEGLKNQLEGVNKRIDDFAETKVSKITYKELDNRVGFIEEKLEIKQ